jgi:hypothetical protein
MDDDRPRLPDGTWAPGGPPPPNRGRRRKGIANKITRDLKSGMIDSAIEHGRDGNGLDGLKGFCAYLLRTDLKAYCSILGRMIPINVQGDVAVGITSVNIVSVPSGEFLTKEEINKLSPPVLEVVADIVEEPVRAVVDDEAERRDEEDAA